MPKAVRDQAGQGEPSSACGLVHELLDLRQRELVEERAVGVTSLVQTRHHLAEPLTFRTSLGHDDGVVEDAGLGGLCAEGTRSHHHVPLVVGRPAAWRAQGFRAKLERLARAKVAVEAQEEEGSRQRPQPVPAVHEVVGDDEDGGPRDRLAGLRRADHPPSLQGLLRLREGRTPCREGVRPREAVQGETPSRYRVALEEQAVHEERDDLVRLLSRVASQPLLLREDLHLTRGGEVPRPSLGPHRAPLQVARPVDLHDGVRPASGPRQPESSRQRAPRLPRSAPGEPPHSLR